MAPTLARFSQCVLRGYGQLFLANGSVPGALILAALLVLSPIDALRSLGCAAFVTAWALWRPSDAMVDTGLFGVNGVLLGLLGLHFPELSEPLKSLYCACGALAMTAVMIPLARFIRKREWPITLFSVPYVIAGWSLAALMLVFGHLDPQQSRAWTELSRHHPELAIERFEAAQPATPRAEGFRQNGLGWAAYQLGNFGDANRHFVTAAELLPGHADSLSGLGWSNFKTNRYDGARKHFAVSLLYDSWNADAWDGLGWILLYDNNVAEADRHFANALNITPFSADAVDGRYECAVRTGDVEAQRAYLDRSAFLKQRVPPGLQRVPLRQAICWLLFLIAIAVHSRTSLIVAATGLTAATLAAQHVPVLKNAMSDVGFIYNLAALSLALGGQYTKLNAVGIIWMAALTIAAAALWTLVEGILETQGIPQLSLVFNACLLGTLLLFSLLRRVRKDCDQSVPMEVAVQSPAAVRNWSKKVSIAKRAWELVERNKRSN